MERERGEPPAEPLLRVVGQCDHPRGLPLAPPPQRQPDGGAVAIVPGGFDQDAAEVRIAGLGDPAVPDVLPAARFTGDHPEEGHQLTRAGKPPEVMELSDDDQRRERVHAPETPQPPDGRAIRLLPGDLGDVGVELADPRLELCDGEQGVVEDHLVRGVDKRQLVQPAPVGVGPRPGGRCRARPAGAETW